MRPRQLQTNRKSGISYLVTALCLALTPLGSMAQTNYNMGYRDVENRSLDYMTIGNQYLLLGQSLPPNIWGMDNTSPVGGNINRMQLQTVDTASMTVILNKIYCTQDEVSAIMDGSCPSLSVSFWPWDAKQTSDGGFIVCGMTRRDRETMRCTMPEYSDPFLLKLSPSGTVQWYRRYSMSRLSHFSSVVEDASSGNIIVCGTFDYASTGYRGFYLVTDAMGATLANGRNNDGNYTEITPYNNGSQYYVLTGDGNLLTLIDNAGTVFQNITFTSNTPGYTLSATAVNDAHDNDVVITGSAMLGTNTGAFVLKIDPMSLGTSFMKYYAYGSNYVSPYSITRPNATGDIYLTGLDLPDGAFYMRLDPGGSVVRYSALTNTYAGMGIVYDPVNNWEILAGRASTGFAPNPTFLLRNKYNQDCGKVPAITPVNLTLSTAAAGMGSLPITMVEDNLLDFDFSNDPFSICAAGQLKQAAAGAADPLAADDKLQLSPNPAGDYITVESNSAEGTLQVFDITGRLVLSQRNNKVTRLDIAPLEPGTYLLRLDGNNGQQQARFFKQ